MTDTENTEQPTSHTYTVDVDGTRVFEQTIDGPASTENFPVEYRHRPMTGEVVLSIGGEIVGVQIPLHIEDPTLAKAHAINNPEYAAQLREVAPEFAPPADDDTEAPQ